MRNKIFKILGVATVIASLALSVFSYQAVQKQTQTIQGFGATGNIPTTVSLFETALQSAITTSDTSMTLVSGTDRAGNSLSGFICFTLDSGTAVAEFVCGTASGSSITSMTRGIDPQQPYTTVVALQFAHRRGADVKVTDYPHLAILSRILNGTDTIPNVLTYGSAPVFNTNLQVIDKQYADGLAIAGAPNGNATTKGIFQEATIAQINAGTLAGSTGADLAVNPSILSSSIYNTQLPTSAQKSALAGNNTDIAVGAGNLYITQTGLQKSPENYVVDSSVSANTITVTLAPVPTSYAAGMVIRVKVANAVTGATTINANALGAKSVTKNGTAALVANDIVAAQVVTLVYDGTQFQLQTPPTSPLNLAIGNEAASYSVSANSNNTSTGFSVTTDGTQRLYISYGGNAYHTGDNVVHNYTITLLVDASTVATTSCSAGGSGNTTAFACSAGINFVTSVLSAASHTVALKVAESGGTSGNTVNAEGSAFTIK